MSGEHRFARYPSLENRSVFVTGGGSGIGAVLVEEFARQGARVGFVDIATECSHALVERLKDVRHVPFFVQCDLTDISALKSAIAQVEDEIGTVEVLVNNAANDDRHRWEDVTPEYWDDRMAVNLRHQFFAIQAVAPGMKDLRSGSIINVSSISWLVTPPNMTIYISAKAAVVGLTRSMARELGPDNIRVNCILPGAVVTERQLRLWRSPEYDRIILDNQCLKRQVVPADVARLALFLAADDSSAITDQSYVVDGGWL
jgi:NAD(P)-dependent dehydrogenase (short-subunit alcohol dehydrogenase family)